MPHGGLDGGNDERLEQLAAVVATAGEITSGKQSLSFFSDKTYKSEGGQQVTGKCIFCLKSKSVASTGSTRLVNHLMSCSAVPKSVKIGFSSVVAETDRKRDGKR
eukprot:scaffold6717_cov133-Isochrysis_galbana.AAC.1